MKKINSVGKLRFNRWIGGEFFNSLDNFYKIMAIIIFVFNKIINIDGELCFEIWILVGEYFNNRCLFYKKMAKLFSK